MTMLSVEQLKVLKKEIGDPLYQDKSPVEIVEILHTRPQIVITPNAVLKPFTLIDILSILSSESAAKLVQLPLFTDVRDKIVNQDREAVALYAAFLLKANIVSESEVSVMNEILSRTEQPEDIISFGKSRFESSLCDISTIDKDGNIEIKQVAIKYFPGMPNKIREIDIQAALELEI